MCATGPVVHVGDAAGKDDLGAGHGERRKMELDNYLLYVCVGRKYTCIRPRPIPI